MMLEKWIMQLDYVASINLHMNTKRTLRENADGMSDAFCNRLKKEREYASLMCIE